MSYQIQLIYQNNVRITDNHPHPEINNFLKLSILYGGKQESTIPMKIEKQKLWSDLKVLKRV